MKTFAISFLCSPSKMRKDGLSPVQCSISVNADRVMYTLPVRCKPSEFKKLSSKPSDVKTLIDNTEDKINKYRTLCEVQGTPCTARGIKAHLEGKQYHSYTLEQLGKEFIMTKAKSVATYKKYKATFKRMSDEWGNDTEVEAITRQDVLNYHSKYSDIYSGETLKGEMKRIKAFFNYAFNAGKIKSNPFAGVKFQFAATDQDYLTYEELCRIRDCKLDERLDKVRNCFLFMAFSGLEYSDLVHLEKSDVKKNAKGQYYIKKKRIKTGIEYLTILFEEAEELWKVYEGDIPVISNAKTNAYLKEIATAAGIEKSITTLTARHSFATYLLSERMIPVDIVQRCLGHTSPKQSLHYAKMLDETVFNIASASTHLSKAKKARN